MLKSPRKFELEAAVRDILKSVEVHNQAIIGTTLTEIKQEVRNSKVTKDLTIKMEKVQEMYEEVLELQGVFSYKPKTCTTDDTVWNHYGNKSIETLIYHRAKAIYEQRVDEVDSQLCKWRPTPDEIITDLVLAEQGTLIDSIRKILSDRGIVYHRDLEAVTVEA